jgi:ankyrin repeat protein
MNDHGLALLLLDHGADPNLTDHNGATALNLVKDTDHELIDALLKRGARFGQPNAPGTTVGSLLQAILLREDYLATGLLRRDGLQRDVPCAAVMYAAAVLNPQPILGYNEDPPPPRTGHRTALMYAAAAGSAEISRLLVQHRANARAADDEGRTALDYARSPEVRVELQAAPRIQ